MTNGIQPDTIEENVFAFLIAKYVQRSDERQKAMGLQYTEAETHDLAKQIARLFAPTFEDITYWQRGHAVVETRLAKAVKGEWADAPFPLDDKEAALWHRAQAEAYRDALEMMGVPSLPAPTRKTPS